MGQLLIDRRAPRRVSRRLILLLLVVELLLAVLGGWRVVTSLTPRSPSVLHVDGATFTVTAAEQVSG